MRLCAYLAILLILLAIAGCAADAINRASPSPSHPWTAGGDAGQGNTPRGQTGATADFGVPANSQLSLFSSPVDVDTSRSYGLAGLIDLAQRSNPATRNAWEKSRQAALAVGMAEATYLPLITASVIAGAQKTDTSLRLPLVGHVDVDTTIKGVAPVLALQWLVFDFGQRAALTEAARQVSFAANIGFNATHQKLIFDVTRRYHEHLAAREAHGIATQTLANSKAVLRAVQARLDQGTATTIELALARQQVAQSQLRLVRAAGQQQDTYQTLLGAMGVNATLELKVEDKSRRRLPDKFDGVTDAMLESALQRRPDLLAGYAAMKASQAGVKAAQASYLPKIFVAGTLASNSGGLQAGHLPELGSTTAQSGVAIVATMPIFDGGVRAAQVKHAQAGAGAAAETFRQLQLDAVSEIVIAANTLSTALEANKAAGVLVQTSSTAFDAALEAYGQGLATIVTVNETNNSLLDARLARTDAQTGALIAAANLAFFTGALTSADRVPGHQAETGG